jgi:hypothetical protein
VAVVEVLEVLEVAVVVVFVVVVLVRVVRVESTQEPVRSSSAIRHRRGGGIYPGTCCSSEAIRRR